jgi:hypothetical protein
LVALTSANYNVEKDAKDHGVLKVTYREIADAETVPTSATSQRAALVLAMAPGGTLMMLTAVALY